MSESNGSLGKNRSHSKTNGEHAGTNLESAGAYNRRVILQAVRLYAPISRPELARITGLTLPAVNTIAADLIERDLVRKSGKRTGGRGQPAVELSINPDGGLTFGVSIGADHIVIVLVDIEGKVRERVEHTLSQPDPNEVCDLIASYTKRIANKQAQNRERILGIGVAVPARFGDERGELIPPPYLDSWRGTDIPKKLGTASGLRVWVENDANAAALGESYYGAGQEVSNFLYVYIGFGVGAGLIIDRELYRGVRGNAGAISLIQFAEQRVPSSQSQRPYGGATGTLYELLREQGLNVSVPSDLEPLFANSHPQLIEWLDTSAEMLSTSIAAAQCLLDPEVILFGGRIPASMLHYLVEKLVTKMPPWLASAGHQPKLLHATSGVDAAALGAAILPFYNEVVPRRQSALKKHPETSRGQSIRF